MTADTPVRVLISYSHDSPEHTDRVLDFANQLREHGVDAWIDQYEPVPKLGWPAWMQQQIERADFVLCVCTEEYKRRFNDEVETDVGRGVSWEANLIRNAIYNSKATNNTQFLVIQFDEHNAKNIPAPLQSYTAFPLKSFQLDDSGYLALYRHLTSQPEVEKPAIGRTVNLPPRQRKSDGTPVKISAEKTLSNPSVLPDTDPGNQMNKKKVFVSHSSADREFVSRLVNDLKELKLDDVWFDAHSISVGDSIPQELEKGLKDADYVIVVLSPNSVQSRWVKRELDATLMSDDTLVLPVLIDDCEIPELLKSRKYADFRSESNYNSAFNELAEILTKEQTRLPTIATARIGDARHSACVQELGTKSRGDLRRWITRDKKFNRDQIKTIWRDLLQDEMENDHRYAPLNECVSILIGRMIDKNCHDELLKEICSEANHHP